jgi:hypothetical protein
MHQNQNTKPCLGHILFIGLEFVEPIFSGNGILTHSLTQGLLDLGYHVSVICAKPSLLDDGEKDDVVGTAGSTSHIIIPHSLVEPFNQKQLHIFPIPVPAHKWKRLDRFSAWEDMAQLASEEIHNNYPDEALLVFDKADFVFCIDWSALPTYDSLLGKFDSLSQARLVYYVFRVFSMSCEIFTERHCLDFYQYHELRAMQKADLVLVISHVDKKALQQLVENNNSYIGHEGKPLIEQKDDLKIDYNKASRVTTDLHVIVPPLRSDLLNLIQHAAQNPSSVEATLKQQRRYIMCNVRISPEKNAMVFAQLMRILSDQHIFQRYNLQPLLIGVICDESYACKVRMLLPPEAKWISDFLKPSDLIMYMKESVILIHPSTYEAYGMIIAEAAAVGTPSLIHFENIGASSWFRESEEEILTTDMRCLDTLSQKLLQILKDQENGIAYLSRIGKIAQQRAFMWTTVDCAHCISEKLSNFVRASN